MDVREKFNQAMTAQVRGDYRTGIELLNEVLLETPNFPVAWNNRASMLQKMGHPFDAVMNYDKAYALATDAVEVINNRGTAYMEMDRFDKAILDFEFVTERRPKLAEPWNNIGNSLMRLGLIKDAANAYRKAVELKPGYEEAHLGLSFSELKQGNFKEGWKEFEWRWKSSQMEPRNLPCPEWQGEKAENSDDILLLYGEQGMGDVLHFVRYAPLIKEHAWRGKVYVEVRHPLTRIVQTLKGIDGVVTLGDKMPDGIKCCSPLMSAPLHLQPYIGNTIPNDTPYLFPDPHRVSLWRERIKLLPAGLFVGICWAGMNRSENLGAAAIDRRRSLSLNAFGGLATPGVSWVSLQTGPPASQIRNPPPGMMMGDFTSDFYDFYDTAATIEALDLVITVDTAVAHVAGAIGKPTWLLSRFDGCWRWLINREDTPWYPTMRIFNQRKPGDWEEVMQRVSTELSKTLLWHMQVKNG